MNVSYQWLAEYIDLGQMDGRQLAELMTKGGIEIDIIEQLNKGISDVVVGYVAEKEKHPDADKLNVCKVDTGSGELLQIVCGAPNVAAGQKVPVAIVGAKLPGDFKIKRAKLRGVESQGMICSAKELGLNDKLLSKDQQEGILVLPESAELGTPITEYLALNDEVLELDLTPNRSDCLSMLGAAYEVAALTGKQVKLPDSGLTEGDKKAADYISVQIDAKEQCAHYAARYITGVTPAGSPQWLKNKLLAAGVRPINNIVDVTNYVMLEYGQPLHAFDADLIPDGAVHIRYATEGEVLVTLDDQERKLDAGMLVIADNNGPIALAGVMGGASTEVTSSTVNILLESAKFSESTVRKTSRKLGLRSEASLRFEKEADAGNVAAALDRAAALIASLSGGEVALGIVEDKVKDPELRTIQISLEMVNRYLGTELSHAEVAAILERLQFVYQTAEQDFVVTIPSRRGDIGREVDLIEEVARLYGYDHIPTTPIYGEVIPGTLTKAQTVRREIRRRLADSGLYEVVSYSFTSPAKAALFPQLTEGAKPIKLAMPMSEERSVLRTALIPQLLEIAAYNRNRKNDTALLFELGSVYHTAEETLTTLPNEKHRFAALLTGNRTAAAWNSKAETVDFYDAKGVLETLFAVLGVSDKIAYVQAQPEHFHPGRTAEVRLQTAESSEVIGYVGQIHPDLQREEELADTYAIEIELDKLYALTGEEIVYQILPKYPAIQRDIAVVVDDSVSAADLIAVCKAQGGELLKTAKVFDVFRGERLGEGKKSVAISLSYRHQERTLTDEEVTAQHNLVTEHLEQTFAAQLRK